MKNTVVLMWKVMLIGCLLPAVNIAQQVQWASGVVGFSSEYAAVQWGSMQVIGPPSVMPGFGESFCAWSPKIEDNRDDDYITVSYTNPIAIRQIVINENQNPGAITKVICIDTDNAEHVVFTNTRPMKPEDPKQPFRIIMELTPYKVKAVKVVLSTMEIDGFQAIDCIGISESATAFEFTVNTAKNLVVTGKKENLGEKVNSLADELCPVISPDGKQLYFTREKHDDNIGNSMTQDIWFSNLENGTWDYARNMGRPINTPENNYLSAITPDGQMAIIGNVYNKDGTLTKGSSYITMGTDGWEFPKKLNIQNYYNSSKYCEYSLGTNGKVLILSPQRDDSKGGQDIYVSFLQEDGNWSEPKNLGAVVNTGSDDGTPFLAADMVTLYYSTSGKPGYGSNDMFVTRRLDDTWTNWSEPENLGPVLNTEKWDAYYTIPARGDYAYFVSVGADGSNDIFRVPLPDVLKPKPVVLIYGNVYDAKTKKPISANITYEQLSTGNELGIARSNPGDGAYKIVLPVGEEYGFLGEANGYIAVSENVSLMKTTEYMELKRDLYLYPIESGSTIRLNNIFFETAKFDLKAASYSELDRLVDILKKNPGIKIEISGHTDDIGTDESNNLLSKNRANSVMQYLLSKGIAPERLTARGYGETKPVLPNTTDANRQQNRRVEITIQ